MITTDNGLFLSFPLIERAENFIVYTTICLFERNKLPFVSVQSQALVLIYMKALFHWTIPVIIVVNDFVQKDFHLHVVIMNNSPRNNNFLSIMQTHNLILDVYLIFL